MDAIHKILGAMGGKKLLALLLGVILWVVYHKTGVTPDQVNTVVTGATPISQSADVSSLLTMISAYVVGQGVADGLSKGATSSTALVTGTGDGNTK